MIVVKLSPRGRRLAIALFLSTSLSTVAFAQSAAKQSEQGALDAFFASRYTYCDAKLVGALWGMEPDRGKIEIGLKILNGITGNLPAVMEQSRANGSECSWEDTGYSYQDAEQLAMVWGLATPDEAKVQAAWYVTNDQPGLVDAALGR